MGSTPERDRHDRLGSVKVTHPLLLWIGETRSGRISQLRDIAAAYVRGSGRDVPFPATARWLSDLSMLGVLNLAWETDRWAAIRPCLTQLPGNLALGMLSGSTPVESLERLMSSELQIDIVQNGGNKYGLPIPDVIVVQADNVREFEAAAKDMGARFALCIAELLADSLPRVTKGANAAGPNYPRTPVERYEVIRHDFEAIQRPPIADGTYRQKISGRWTHWLLRDGEWSHTDRPAGILLELERLGINPLEWQPYSSRSTVGSLLLSFGVDLPVAQARAAVLCSGFLPQVGDYGAVSRFDNVSREVASSIALSVGVSRFTAES